MGSTPCKKIKVGSYSYRVTGCADFHGLSKREIKWLIDESMKKNNKQRISK